MSTIGVVVIGRNEGQRLTACLQSIRRQGQYKVIDVVYVDSNSTDTSVEVARGHGAFVVQLPKNSQFTAALARNAGANVLLKRQPAVDYLQFFDGDVEINAKWLTHAAEYLDGHKSVAVVCGRRRERWPDNSFFNLVTDMEWDTPIGEATEFGGDAMIRASVFQQVGGYNATFIAGEEPDLAARIRLADFKIIRLDHEMTLHDIAMKKITAWWKRTVRSGHALAQLAHTHGKAPLYMYKKQWRSTIVWAVGVPVVVAILALVYSKRLWWLLPAALALLVMRITLYRKNRGDNTKSALIYGFLTAAAKWPQFIGLCIFYRNLWRKKPTTLMEYKANGPAASKSVPLKAEEVDELEEVPSNP